MVTMPLKNVPSDDGRFMSENITGSIMDSEAAESCTVSDSKDIACKSVATGKENGSGYLKVCRANGTYNRHSIEAMTLTAQYLIEENFKFYNSVSGRKMGLLPAQMLAQLKLKQDYQLPNGVIKTLYTSDNAAFQSGESGENSVFFHLYPTSTAEFLKSGNNLWEVPFVMRHEFAHHVFEHYIGESLARQGISPSRHFMGMGPSILPRGEGRPKAMALSDTDINVLSLNGMNETYADLYAYFQGGAVKEQLKGVSCLQVSRDPSSSTTKGGAPKGLTVAQINIFEGKSAANDYSNCYEPTYDEEHDIATALGYPLAQFIKEANSGVDAAGHARVMLLWASRINQLVSNNFSSVSTDTLVRELVLTLKSDMGKSILAACAGLKPSITGLPQASAECK
jgi:hypothetical protein